MLESVKDVAEPEYFQSNAFWGRTVTKPDLWVHMTLSRDYDEGKMGQGSVNGDGREGMGVNRMLVELGDRFSGVRNKSDMEICVAADPCK